MSEQSHSEQNTGNSVQNLEKGIEFLRQLIQARLSRHLAGAGKQVAFPAVPKWEADHSPFFEFMNQRQPEFAELTAFMLALIPHVNPGFFDQAIGQFLPNGGDVPNFGGIKGEKHRGMLPTGETLIFLVAGNDLKNRLICHAWIQNHRFFNIEQLVKVGKPAAGDPPMSGRLDMDEELVEWLLTGQISIPEMSSEFPAKYLSSELAWEDLILTNDTSRRVEELQNWLRHSSTLMHEWGMKKILNPGYRVLFHGPPGTGKTLTATLLGKSASLPVFRIDLSMVVSKYIGETEKNLSSLFDKAEFKNWILFFDEADSLFGKRTNVRDAHDKYANQEVSYLLQRIETYPGLVILATNFKNNIDEAFLRRFQSVVYFPAPGPEERLRLWKNSIPDPVSLSDELNLKDVASRFELTGSNIINIIQHASIQLLTKNSKTLTPEVLFSSIQHEYMKEGKMMAKQI